LLFVVSGQPSVENVTYQFAGMHTQPVPYVHKGIGQFLVYFLHLFGITHLALYFFVTHINYFGYFKTNLETFNEEFKMTKKALKFAARFQTFMELSGVQSDFQYKQPWLGGGDIWAQRGGEWHEIQTKCPSK